MEAILESREGNYYRNRKVATLEGARRSQDKLLDPFEREIIKPILESDSLEGYDDDLPLVIQSESLKEQRSINISEIIKHSNFIYRF